MSQESVWDYPRPPAVVPTHDRIRVVHAGVTIADTIAAVRVLETSQPPAFYFPRADVSPGALRPGSGRSFCEWKGPATYWSVVAGDVVVPNAAWSYEDPTPPFVAIRGHIAFYARLLDECWVGDEQVVANPGSFYGGWITSRVTGPFKGDPAPSTGSGPFRSR
ncbi:MAG: hypothetical protein JWL72_1904 [Ilumatobacteraceae bacterium]|nr:hypothetical protein [Ilumatobacteraceae bacterium]MCU1388566.1 hypothetical protein [Ilumatobacteraceae bacterium]